MAPSLHHLSLLSLLLSLSGCSEPGIELLVELRTDLQPGVEFSSVRTVLDDGSVQERAVFVGDELMAPTRVAEFDGLIPAERTVRVALLDDTGAVVAERPATFFHEADFGLRVVITRACVGVVCPGASDGRSLTACHGGACVPPECIHAGDSACPAAQCASDAECGGAARSCANVRCIEGLCMDGPDLDCGGEPPPVPQTETPPGAALDSPVLVLDESLAPPPRCLSSMRLPLLAIDGMLTLSDGTLVVYGSYGGEVTFGDVTHTASGVTDAIIVALDSEGAALWSVSLPSAQTVQVNDAVAIDDEVYVVGRFGGTMTVGTSTFSAQSDDGFVVRIDRSGIPRTVRTFGGLGNDHATSIAHYDGSVFVGGWFTGPAEFSGVFHTSLEKDSFVLRLMAPDLTRMSSWTFGSREDTLLSDLDVSGGSIYLGGSFEDDLVLAADALFAWDVDAFVAMADFGGALRWGDQISARGIDRVQGVVAADDYVVYAGTASTMTTDGSDFVRAYRRDGMLVWEHELGDPAQDNQSGNVLYEDGVVYTSHALTLPVDIDGLTITGVARRDLVVTAHDLETGRLRWHQVLGSEGDVIVPRIALGTDDDMWVSAIITGDLQCESVISTYAESGRSAVFRLRR